MLKNPSLHLDRSDQDKKLPEIIEDDQLRIEEITETETPLDRLRREIGHLIKWDQIEKRKPEWGIVPGEA